MFDITTTNALTMSSREIAELTGKEHKNVLADIRKMLDELDMTSAQFSADLPDTYGRAQTVFNLPKRETLILVSGYSVELRARIIDRWQELETKAAAAIPPQHKPRRVQSNVSESAKIALMLYREAVKIAGVDKPTMLAKTLEVVSAATGDNYQPMMLALPAVAPAEVATLTPTLIGKQIGMKASDVNLALESLGLQYRDDAKELRLTDAGTAFGDMKPYHRRGHSGVQIHWRDSVIDVLRNSLTV